jgi:hypothetical protein
MLANRNLLSAAMRSSHNCYWKQEAAYFPKRRDVTSP